MEFLVASSTRITIASFPQDVVIPANHFYRVYDASGKLLARIEGTRPTQVLDEVRDYGGLKPYTVELYTEPKDGDHIGPIAQVTRGEQSLTLFAHGHELSTEVVSAKPQDQTMIAKCSCGWQSTVAKHDVVIDAWERHRSKIDFDRFGATIDPEL